MKKGWIIFIAIVACMLFGLHSYKYQTLTTQLRKEHIRYKQELKQCQLAAERQMELATHAMQQANQAREQAEIARQEAETQHSAALN